MDFIKKHIPKSRFFKDVVTLMTGTVIAQAVPILASIVLTRIYSAADFGVFAIFQSIVLVLSVFATGRYELAIVLPKKDSAAANIFILASLITFASTLFISLGMFGGGWVLVTHFQQLKGLGIWLYFIPLMVFLIGVFQISSYWHNRQRQFKTLSIGKVIKGVFNAFASVVLGLWQASAGSLIISLIISQLLAWGYLQYHTAFSTKIYRYYSLQRMRALARRYRDFPTVNMLHSGINVLKDNAVNILIAIQYTASALGYYYLVLRAMKLPAGLIGYSVSQVFLKEAADRYQNTGAISNLVYRLIKRLFFIAFIPLVIVLLFVEDLFIFVFGADWSVAGTYAQALSVYIFFHFIASPLGMIPIIVEQQKKAFWWGLTESLLFVACYLMGYYLYQDLYKTLFLLSIVMGGYFLIYFRWIYSISKGKTKN